MVSCNRFLSVVERNSLEFSSYGLLVLLLESYDSVPFCSSLAGWRGWGEGRERGVGYLKRHGTTPTTLTLPLPLPSSSLLMDPCPIFSPAHTTCLCFVLGGLCSYSLGFIVVLVRLCLRGWGYAQAYGRGLEQESVENSIQGSIHIHTCICFFTLTHFMVEIRPTSELEKNIVFEF